MRILQVNKFFPPHLGGIETHVALLCRELARTGQLDLSVLVCHHRPAWQREIFAGVPVERVPSYGTFLSMPLAPHLFGAFRELAAHADLVHLHHPFPLAELAALLLPVPGRMVVTWHNDIVRQRLALRLYQPFLQRFLKRVDRIILTSPHYLQASAHLRPYREKCQSIPLGIDLEPFRWTPETAERASRLRSQYGSRLILGVGRLVAYKGFRYLVEAMTRVNGHLVIIGQGPLRRELSALARTLGLERRVTFLDPVPLETLAAFYHACTVFVLPSINATEGFGLVQVEAMACGKPVVSTNLPTGVTYVNRDGETGLVVPSGDATALALAITRLLDDHILRERLGAQARARVWQEFTVERMAAQTYALYQDLLASAPVPAPAAG